MQFCVWGLVGLISNSQTTFAAIASSLNTVTQYLRDEYCNAVVVALGATTSSDIIGGLKSPPRIDHQWSNKCIFCEIHRYPVHTRALGLFDTKNLIESCTASSDFGKEHLWSGNILFSNDVPCSLALWLDMRHWVPGINGALDPSASPNINVPYSSLPRIGNIPDSTFALSPSARYWAT